MPGEQIASTDPLGNDLAGLKDRIAALESSNQWSAGMIAWTASDTAPPGFLIADGSTFDGDRYAALAAVLGGTTLPNLIDRFPMGAGGSYTLLSAGGSASVTLSAAQSGVPAHTHTATAAAEAAHTHSGTTGAGSAHSHAGVGGTQFTMATGGALGWTTGAQNITFQSNTATESAHTHPFTTGAGSSHTHTITVNSSSAAGAASPVSLLNPYVALTPLVHV